MLPPQLTEICDAFIQSQPFLATPDGALGTCEWVAKEFCRLYPETLAVPVYLSGYRNFAPNRHTYWSNYANPDPDFYHAMVGFPDGTTIDFTHKQIDSDGPVYRIYTRRDLEANWLIVSRDVELLGMTTAPGSYLTRRARILKDGGGYSDHTPLWRQAQASMALVSAERCYRETLNNVASGRVAITGTETDNAILHGLHLEWKDALEKLRNEREVLEGIAKQCCDTYTTSHPRFYNKTAYGAADSVATRCVCATEEFLELNPQLGGDLLQLCGHRTEFANRHDCYDDRPNPDPEFYHVVALLPGGVVVDVTCLQLDSTGPRYRITSFAELQNEWLMLAPIGETAAFSALLSDIPQCLEKSTPEWQDRQYGTFKSVEAKTLAAAAAFEQARKFYLATKERIFGNILVIPDFGEPNPHDLTWTRYHTLFEPKATHKEPLAAVIS